MLRLLILADDLSGAADCAAACAGASTVVAIAEVAGDAEILSIDANTRVMEQEAAAEVIGGLVRGHASGDGVLVFKKIDSTLRGHAGAEIAAALRAYREVHVGAVALLAPALPAAGRTTVDGFQRVHGELLHEAEIWKLHGMSGEAFIPDMMRQAGLESAVISLDAVRSPGEVLVEAMKASLDVLVCDAETDEDLRTLAEASLKAERKILWAGSAGLARHLAGAAGLGSAREERGLEAVSGPLLFVVGSLSRKSLEQVRRLVDSSDMLRIEVPTDVLLGGTGSQRWLEYEGELVRGIEEGRDVLIGPAAEPCVAIAERPLLSAALARMTVAVSGRVCGLIAGGGETARMVLEGWGVAGLRVLGEVEHGVPISVTEGWNRQLPVITKAGDFGNAETLLHCSQFLRQGKAERM